MNHKSDISNLRTTNKVKALLKNTRQLNDQARKFKASSRNLKIDIKNLLEGDYLYQRYTCYFSNG